MLEPKQPKNHEVAWGVFGFTIDIQFADFYTSCNYLATCSPYCGASPNIQLVKQRQCQWHLDQFPSTVTQSVLMSWSPCFSSTLPSPLQISVFQFIRCAISPILGLDVPSCGALHSKPCSNYYILFLHLAPSDQELFKQAPGTCVSPSSAWVRSGFLLNWFLLSTSGYLIFEQLHCSEPNKKPFTITPCSSWL